MHTSTHRRRHRLRALVLLCGAALAVAPLATGRTTEGTSTAATLRLNGTLNLLSRIAGECPAGTAANVVCPARTGSGLVPGLGRVTESYAFLVDVAPPSCSGGSVKVLRYPVRWVVAGKGEIFFSVHERPECVGANAGYNVDQQYTVTGGTGRFAGASGSGNIDRSLHQTDAGAAGREAWTGTLEVPGVEFDVARPTITGAKPKSVRAPRAVKRVRVSYTVTAQDAVDGAVPTRCRPASGSRFKLGRSVVRCSATDTSGNTASAAFAVTVTATR